MRTTLFNFIQFTNASFPETSLRLTYSNLKSACSSKGTSSMRQTTTSNIKLAVATICSQIDFFLFFLSSNIFQDKFFRYSLACTTLIRLRLTDYYYYAKRLFTATASSAEWLWKVYINSRFSLRRDADQQNRKLVFFLFKAQTNRNSEIRNNRIMIFCSKVKLASRWIEDRA